MKLKTLKAVRAYINKTVYWDDDSGRYSITRMGILEDVKGRNLLINGDWKWRPDLTNLRTTYEE